MHYGAMWASDHRHFLIRFASEDEEYQRRRFYFDKRMADMEGFEDLVRRSWEGDGAPDAHTVCVLLDVAGRWRNGKKSQG